MVCKRYERQEGQVFEDALHKFRSTAAKDNCVAYKTNVWFEMGKLLWTRHQLVQEEHIGYLEYKFIKPFDMAIRDFYDQVI
jgi:hypothetical protein